jgi:hypothetical protein
MSEKGIDYCQLRDSLQEGNWKDADAITEGILTQIIEQKSVYVRSNMGYYDPDDAYDIYRIERKPIPCIDLLTMDRLWVNYSEGHFGFSVQAKIYLECLEAYAKEPEMSNYYLNPRYYIKPFELLLKCVGWSRDISRGWNQVYPLSHSENFPDGYYPSALLNLYKNGLDQYSDNFTEFAVERLFSCCMTQYLHDFPKDH